MAQKKKYGSVAYLGGLLLVIFYHGYDYFASFFEHMNRCEAESFEMRASQRRSSNPKRGRSVRPKACRREQAKSAAQATSEAAV